MFFFVSGKDAKYADAVADDDDVFPVARKIAEHTKEVEWQHFLKLLDFIIRTSKSRLLQKCLVICKSENCSNTCCPFYRKTKKSIHHISNSMENLSLLSIKQCFQFILKIRWNCNKYLNEYGLHTFVSVLTNLDSENKTMITIQI